MFRMMSAGGLAAIALAAAFASPAAAAPAAAGARAQAQPPAATAASDIALSGVSCADGAHCLAVGQETANPDIGRDFAQAWNGRSWRVLTPPSPGSPAALNGVACTGPAAFIAVGTYAGTNGQGSSSGGPLAEAWNGTTWRILPTANPGTANANLLSVSCPRADRCTAAGDYFGTTGIARPLTEEWNGDRWRLTT